MPQELRDAISRATATLADFREQDELESRFRGGLNYRPYALGLAACLASILKHLAESGQSLVSS